MDDARWVMEQVRGLEGSSDTWKEVVKDGQARIIDAYEADRAVELLEWAELCAQRDQGKEEAVARTLAEESTAGPGQATSGGN